MCINTATLKAKLIINHIIRVVSFLFGLMRTHSRCRVLLLHLITLHGARARTHTHTFSVPLSLLDFFGRGINPSQTPLPDNTQHSHETGIRAPSGIRTHNVSRWAAAVLDRAATTIGSWYSRKMKRTELNPYRTNVEYRVSS